MVALRWFFGMIAAVVILVKAGIRKLKHDDEKAKKLAKRSGIVAVASFVILFLFFDPSKVPKHEEQPPTQTTEQAQAEEEPKAEENKDVSETEKTNEADKQAETAPASSEQNAPTATKAPVANNGTGLDRRITGDGPNGEGIKGHIGKNGKIYHLPSGRFYKKTKNVSEWFFTEREAQEAGYRRSER